MAERALYVPHSLGVVIGSRQSRPWLARDAEQAIATPWRGQPAFAAATDAFAWLDWARQQPWLPGGLAVAHADVHTDLTAEGIHRIHIGARQLREAANQVLRAHPATGGPDQDVLAACQGIARADAAWTWLVEQAGATAGERTTAAMTTLWDHGYRLAARDARAALAGQVARTLKATQAELATSCSAADARSRDELTSLDHAAATLAAAAALLTVPDPPPSVLAQARQALRLGGELSGWDRALAAVWKNALRTGALDAVVGAATDIETLWRAAPRTTCSEPARIRAQPAEAWVAAMLVDANRVVASAWLLATAQPLPAAAPQPHASAAPTTTTQPEVDSATEFGTAPTGAEPSPPAARAFVALPGVRGEQPAATAAPPPPPGPPGRRR